MGGARTGMDLGQPQPESQHGNPINYSLRAYRHHGRNCHFRCNFMAKKTREITQPR